MLFSVFNLKKKNNFGFENAIIETEFCKWGILEYCRNGRGGGDIYTYFRL